MTSLRGEPHYPEFRPEALGLALSGGGLRAALFHLGVLERLYLLGVLGRVSYLSTVSGGSVVGARVALVWSMLGTVADPASRPRVFDEEVASPLVALAKADVRNRTVRRWLRPKGWGKPGASNLASVLDDLVFAKATLGDLPNQASLQVAINATNIVNGKRFRFSRESVGDWREGYTGTGVTTIPVATAVAASAAFPPVFGSLVLPVDGPFYRFTFDKPPKRLDAAGPIDGRVALTDGGVYDNLGLQAALQRCGNVIAVDAGAPLEIDYPVPRGLFPGARTALRTTEVMMSRIVNLPSQRFVQELLDGTRKGALIRIGRSVAHVASVEVNGTPQLPLESVRGFESEDCARLCRLRTDLDAFSDLEIAVLRFHGRSLADAAVRRFVPQWIEAGTLDRFPLGEAPKLGAAERRALDRGSSRRALPLLAVWEGW